MAARVVVIVNKWWEADPVLWCLTNRYLRTDLPWPDLLHYPRQRHNPASPEPPGATTPRAVLSFPSVEVEVWCISDLLEHLPDTEQYQSSTERKAERLPVIFAEPVNLVIAVGTASAGTIPSLNGSVVLGTKVFMHNSKPNGSNPDSDWRAGPFETVIDSALSPADFAFLTDVERPLDRAVSRSLIAPPQCPSPLPSVLADYAAVAVGNMNVTDYRDYDATDRETLESFHTAAAAAVPGSLETTHGLIRSVGADRFLFVSGIVDRLLHFAEDVNPSPYAQNVAGAHNAGVVVAALLARMALVKW